MSTTALELALTLYDEAIALRDRAAFDDALAVFEQVLAIELGVDDDDQRHGDIGMTLHEVGWLHLQRDDLDAAYDAFVLALAHKRRVPHEHQRHDLLSTTLHELGIVASRLGRHDEALQHWHEAIAINVDIADDDRRRDADAVSWHAIAQQHIGRDAWSPALVAVDAELAALLPADVTRRARALYWRAFALVGLDHRDAAIADLQTALAIYDDMPSSTRDPVAEHHAEAVDALRTMLG